MSKTDPSPSRLQSRIMVLGARITPLDLDGTVRLIMKMAQSCARGYICIVNAHTTTLALRDEQFRAAIDGATAVVADGVPVLWRMRAAGHAAIGRVHGVDLVDATCRAGIERGLRHGFFGGSDGVAEEMAAGLRQRYPTLRIAGAWNPGVIQRGQTTSPSLIDAINASGCDILWVGLGAPKQEIWTAQHRRQLQAPVVAAVGQAFGIIAGRVTRAPDWMGRHGLEWVYRLAHEPGRLWKRYLFYNSLFLWHLSLERLGFSSHDAKAKP